MTKIWNDSHQALTVSTTLLKSKAEWGHFQPTLEQIWILAQGSFLEVITRPTMLRPKCHRNWSYHEQADPRVWASRPTLQSVRNCEAVELLNFSFQLEHFHFDFSSEHIKPYPITVQCIWGKTWVKSIIISGFVAKDHESISAVNCYHPEDPQPQFKESLHNKRFFLIS